MTWWCSAEADEWTFLRCSPRCGAEVAEVSEDTGSIYLSRFYQLLPGAELPPQLGPVGGDLGYVKYAVFAGDTRTFSVTFALPRDDHELRRLLLDADCFDAMACAFPATAAHLDGRAEPLTRVEVMGGLINRRRDFTRNGEVVLRGAVAVGDAHTATNPIYGRGCSLAMLQAKLLCEALESHPDDPAASGRAYETACEEQVLPWYRAAATQDRLNATLADDTAADVTAPGNTAPDEPAEQGIESGEASEVTRARFMADLLRHGLFPAMREDPVVLRAFLAMFNLLRPPDSLMSDGDIVTRVMTYYQDRDNRAPEEPLGPDRETLLAALGSAAGNRGND